MGLAEALPTGPWRCCQRPCPSVFRVLAALAALAPAASAKHVAPQEPRRSAQRTFRAYVPALLMFIVLASSDWLGSMMVSSPLQFFEVWPPQLGHWTSSVRRWHCLQALL